MRRVIALCTIAVLALLCSVSFAAGKPGRLFTVRDSIELERVLPFRENGGATEGAALFSADGAQFLLHIRRGDLSRNVNIESLLLFSTPEVRAHLASRRGTVWPRPRRLVSLDVKYDAGQMAHVQWIDDLTIGFIAGDEDSNGQVFSVDVPSGRLTQLTHAKAGVASFATCGDRIVYYAYVRPARRLAEAAGERALGDLLFGERDGTELPIELAQSSRATGKTVSGDGTRMRLFSHFRRIWVSPSCRYAITLAPATNAPAHWAEYRIPDYDSFGYTPERVSSDPTSVDLMLRVRYQLVDLHTNVSRPLLDAPSGWLSQNRTPLEVMWIEAERTVLVSNTYLPLHVEGAAQRAQRVNGPAIAEIDIVSGTVTPAVWEPVRTTEQRLAGNRLQPIVSMRWQAKKRVLAVSARTTHGISMKHFRKDEGVWHEVQMSDSTSESPSIQLRETLTERPRVYAMGGRCQCAKEIFDPAPTADEFTFGRAEVHRWTDTNGIEWQGGLILPPEYDARKRYPLVLQTHGFNTREFLIDGPYGATTAFAAQALANAGIAVLQVEDNRSALTLDAREAGLFAEGYSAAIESLIKADIADRQKLGLIAFSRTGLPAIRLLADHPNLLAAVVIADASWWGYLQRLLLLDGPADFAGQYQRLVGVSDEPVYAYRFDRDPLYKLPEARAAVRFEANGPAALLGHWEHYAVLRAANRPVDLAYFPEGSHVLQKPAERLVSQGESVDWFRFWFEGYEDFDPRKAAQYQRWRRLRLH